MENSLSELLVIRIIEVRPEEEAMKHISVRVGKILCIYTIGHYKSWIKVNKIHCRNAFVASLD